MDEIAESIRRAGFFFICSVWIQSQMVDLIVLRRNPDAVEGFVQAEDKIPRLIARQRLDWIKHSFGHIATQFEREFEEQMTDQFQKDIKTVLHLRNGIAHAHVSLGRRYMIYRPDSERRMAEIEKDMKVIEPTESPVEPPTLKLDFGNEEIYERNFGAITRLDEQHLRSVAAVVGVPYTRIR